MTLLRIMFWILASVAAVGLGVRFVWWRKVVAAWKRGETTSGTRKRIDRWTQPFFYVAVAAGLVVVAAGLLAMFGGAP